MKRIVGAHKQAVERRAFVVRYIKSCSLSSLISGGNRHTTAIIGLEDKTQTNSFFTFMMFLEFFYSTIVWKANDI